MIINDWSVRFENADAHFVEKYGFFHACHKVRQHVEKYDTPFVQDTHQLAATLALRHRQFFRLLREADAQYERVEIPKKNGGVRVLYAPNPLLKRVQFLILRLFLDGMPISRFATAYCKGKSLRDNASPHTGHTYLLKMDITDFFDSITFPQIVGTAFPKDMYPSHIRAMLTALCCRNEQLPQGAPTSPAISNLVMRRFDDVLGEWCEKHDIAYTRYCDDLTFSANKPLFAVHQKATAMLEGMGFTVNEAKTRFVKNTSRQAVTGLTVNEKVSISAEYKRALRQELHYAIKFGIRDSLVKGLKTAFLTNGQPDTERYYRHLRGKINYVLSVEPQNTWFADALKRLEVVYHWEVYEYVRYGKR
ncbi:MAG: retron St85 family RNA-directed DNA polymerase [Clostridia bacterium]|nr:retron St85 family RNA-directed DNA polymerase [Clostridia bacterium]